MDDQELNGLPPLRGAIIRLLRDRREVTVEVLVQEAAVAPDRALAYLSILCAQRAVRLTGDGVTYAAGGKFDEWSMAACRSRPRHSTHQASDRMSEMFMCTARNVQRLREKREWTRYELANRAGVSAKTVARLETMCRRNIPFPALMLIAKALETPVELLASNC